ncbi:putative acetyltransferase [Apostasia shenzhenica]|uniref:Putative acetyltransferase n=1 Tax=Apostasia shenzhenica TaxID=1088818 RepID=A0A2I0AAC7_9ASPA|nr:putative acetyltransferase [Apostasia shenzhenica]
MSPSLTPGGTVLTVTTSRTTPPPAITSSPALIRFISKCTVRPDTRSTLDELKLSVSDLPMLSCHYIQKGLFFPPLTVSSHTIFSLLARSLSRALSSFPALAGRLFTHPEDGRISISCNDAGVELLHAAAPSLSLPLLLPPSKDVPPAVQSLFALDDTVSYDGHFRPLAAFQFTELGDGAVFIGLTINHAIVDGTSFWNFFNAWAELCRSPMTSSISRPPDLRRNFFGGSTAVLRFSGGAGPKVTFQVGATLRERIFHFSRDAIRALKFRANHQTLINNNDELYTKQLHDNKSSSMGMADHGKLEISSFQSLCAQLWRSVTRARKHLTPEAPTTFRMAVNCRNRLAPPIDRYYFGNAIQSIPTTAAVRDVAESKLGWVAALLHLNVMAHGDDKIRQGVEEWEASPRCFPLGNPDGAGITMGSSPRFPMFDGNDFGWGGPIAVRSGKANKFDGKISAFPGREGGGSIDLEVCLAPETMAALLEDKEFMQYVSAEI